MKDYAKRLYFEIDSEGNHRYYNPEILTKIKDEFPDADKYPDLSTVYRWGTRKNGKESWEELFEEGQRSGLKDAIGNAGSTIEEENLDPELVKEFKPQKTIQKMPEEQVREQAGKILALRAGTAISGYNIGQMYLKSIENEVMKEIKRLEETGQKIMPDDIEAMIDGKKSNAILRVIRTSEIVLNNLNIEVAAKQTSQREPLNVRIKRYATEYRKQAP